MLRLRDGETSLLAGLIRDCRLVELEGARQEVVWTHAEQVIEALEAFL